MRLLHAGHADDGHRFAAQISARYRRADPRGAVRQLVPLHRLRAHRRGRASARAAEGRRAMKMLILPGGACIALDRSRQFPMPADAVSLRASLDRYVALGNTWVLGWVAALMREDRTTRRTAPPSSARARSRTVGDPAQRSARL